MLKIFTELSHYNIDQRKYLADILRPFLPNKRFSEFGINDDIIELVDTIEESDICLLPMAWNYYLKVNQLNIAKELIHRAKTKDKKILVWVRGDYFITLPDHSNIIGMYYSIYNSKSSENT